MLGAIIALWLLTREGLLVLLLAVALFATLGGKPAGRGDGTALGRYLFLLAALTALGALPVALP